MSRFAVNERVRDCYDLGEEVAPACVHTRGPAEPSTEGNDMADDTR